jgi:hypothetical protein
MNITAKEASGNALSNTQITTHNKPSAADSESVAANIGGGTVQTVTNQTNSQTTTDTSGNAKIIVYDYELTDVSGSAMLSAVQQNNFYPHTIAVGSLFTTLADSSNSAWDALTSSGTYTLSATEGSVLVNTNTGSGSTGTTPPAAPSGLSVR